MNEAFQRMGKLLHVWMWGQRNRLTVQRLIPVIKFDYEAIAFIKSRPFESGQAWIILRGIISAFYVMNYKHRVFRLEYVENQPGFHRSKQDKMTHLVMSLAGVNKMFRAVLRSKCVFRDHEWDFIKGSIDPPTVQERCQHIDVDGVVFGATPWSRENDRIVSRAFNLHWGGRVLW
jgi:hypothetical protein